MSLSQSIKEFKLTALKQIPVEVKEKMYADVEELAATGIVESSPKVGEQLKDFALVNQVGETKRLSDYLNKGPVIITFYRGGWCPYCNLELRAYQDLLPEITAVGGTLIAITPELPDESLNTHEKHNLEFDILSDVNSNYAKEIGIAFELSELIQQIYEKFGFDLDKHNGKNQYTFPMPATYAANKDGEITFAFASADYTQRAEPRDVLNSLKQEG